MFYSSLRIAALLLVASFALATPELAASQDAVSSLNMPIASSHRAADMAAGHEVPSAASSRAADRQTRVKHSLEIWDSTPAERQPFLIRLGIAILYVIVAIVSIYAVRHFWFTFNRLLGKQRHPYVPIEYADWPGITVLIPCHNEEAVVANCIQALLGADYPQDRMRIMPVNDRSKDGTEAILDSWAARFPDRVAPFHRRGGKPGKSAALKDAIELVEDDIIVVFDADYIPGSDLLKRIVAPFLDPETGAVMGRVVPMNASRNLLTRLLDLERSGGYQVDQQARMNLGVIPQYGGTVGGVRVSALEAVGGWREDSLAEDTDITFRLVLGGWKVAYSNRYECYEEVPEDWTVRIKQIKRWARGHVDAAIRYFWPLVFHRHLTFREKLDGGLLLLTYFMSPVLFIGWMLALALFYAGANPLQGAIAVLAIASYSGLGNFAAFFEMSAAVRLDGTIRRIRLLPLVLVGFIVSLVATTQAVLTQVWEGNAHFHWDKTVRYRQVSPAPPAPARTPEPPRAPAANTRKAAPRKKRGVRA